MSPPEQKQSNWSSVKAAVSKLSPDEQLTLLRNLYELSPSNKQFMDARFRLGKDQFAPYKKIIGQCMYPNVDRNRAVQISKAKKAISEYRKATSDIHGGIDLMIHFVECGNEFTLDYGDINGPFYDALLSMYAKAVDAVAGLSEREAEPFRKDYGNSRCHLIAWVGDMMVYATSITRHFLRKTPNPYEADAREA